MSTGKQPRRQKNTTDSIEELPLLDLFTRLREAGLPLGIDEYRLLVKALQAGFGMSDSPSGDRIVSRDALKRLCRTLWIKSAKDEHLFNHHFDQLIPQPIISEAPVRPSENYQQEHAKEKIENIPIVIVILTVIAVFSLIVGFGIFLKIFLLPSNPNPTQPVGSVNRTILFISLLIIIVSTVALTIIYRRYIRSVLLEKVLNSLKEVLNGLRAILSLPNRVERDTPKPTPTTHLATTYISMLTRNMDDEIQRVQAVLKATSRNDEITSNRFSLTTEYFPVTRRQMKQSWRFMRRRIREGAPIELDVEATVNQISHQGILLDLVLVPPRVHRVELLLIDRDGSMVPFHELSHRLAETSLRGGRLGKSGIYYFHNYPIDYLYRDPYHLDAESLQDILLRLHPTRYSVLIISDAGAARGGYSQERVELTKKFLDRLRQRVRYVAWLNPMPRSRWEGTSAGAIARLVPMFEITHRGLLDAIGVLRGRPTNFEGRIK